MFKLVQYNYDEVVVDPKYQCGVCLGPLNFPVRIACGHVFCYECLEQYVHERKQQHVLPNCPLCKVSIQADDIQNCYFGDQEGNDPRPRNIINIPTQNQLHNDKQQFRYGLVHAKQVAFCEFIYFIIILMLFRWMYLESQSKDDDFNANLAVILALFHSITYSIMILLNKGITVEIFIKCIRKNEIELGQVQFLICHFIIMCFLVIWICVVRR